MSMIFNRTWKPALGCNRAGLVHMSGTILIGSSGAVTSYDLPGATVTLVNSKTGRYRIQLVASDGSTAANPNQPTSDAAGTTATTPYGFQGITAMYVSPTTDNAIAVTNGTLPVVRNFTPLSGYFDLQCCRPDTMADANPESGAQLLVSFDVKLSSVTP